ncbi:hypothetical protein G6L89_024830 (plasmid) [Agrobacterium fabrum]|uniref:hypothetical protein n=1 Tax=Agrobacterium fabrum TaxID=1176649 RepID=UPI001574168F|nr:hypothetical protein [Agrobacterium fabrum]NTB10593.1 hypothetical protein [Agrobacterium fabrum]
MADLVSRKPKPDSHDESPAVGPKTIALEYRPSLEAEHPDSESAVRDRSAEPGSEAQGDADLRDPDTGSTDIETATPVTAKAPAAPAGNEEPAALPTSQQPEEDPTPAQAAATLVESAPGRQKKIKPIAEPVVVPAQTDEEAHAVAAGPKSFMDEMADLDAEVDALRRQLAKKLVEQNVQLRKMLARFDAS